MGFVPWSLHDAGWATVTTWRGLHHGGCDGDHYGLRHWWCRAISWRTTWWRRQWCTRCGTSSCTSCNRQQWWRPENFDSYVWTEWRLPWQKIRYHHTGPARWRAKIRELIQTTWEDHYVEETVFFRPRPQPHPEDESDGLAIYVVVNFMEPTHPLHAGRVACLVDIQGWDEETNLQVRTLEAALVPERTTWHRLIAELRVQELCRQRSGNQCLIKIGHRLILDDGYFNFPDDSLLKINYQIGADDPERMSLMQLGHQLAIRQYPAQQDANKRPDASGANASASQEGALDHESGTASSSRPVGREAHLFHLATGYIVGQLDSTDPVQRHAQVAAAWGARPEDIDDGKEALITRWANDDVYQVWPNDVLILIDIDIETNGGPGTSKKRSVRWFRR